MLNNTLKGCEERFFAAFVSNIAHFINNIKDTLMSTIITTATIAADKSAKTLVAVSSNTAKVVADLQALVETVPAVIAEIAAEEQRLEAVKNLISEEERKGKAELAIRLLENEEAVLMELLDKRKLALIPVTEVEKLNADLEKANGDIEEAIADAVADAVAKSEAEKEAQIVKLEADHKVEVAQKDADLTAANAKVAHLEATITSLNAMINSEREAQTARFEASRPVVQQVAPVAQR